MIHPCDRLLERLNGVRETASGEYLALCPAHEDSKPSLSIKRLDDRVLVHCFAGCPSCDVVEAVGLSMSDLFVNTTQHAKPASEYLRRRNSHAHAALRALGNELRAAQAVAYQLRAGQPLSEAEIERLDVLVSRIDTAVELTR